jgi:Flp pilus assembly protein TadB
MQDFDNIKELWKKTNTELPSSKEVLAEVERTRKKMMRKSILGIITLSLTFAFITFIGFHYEFGLWTTRAGIIIVLTAICLGVFFMSGISKLLMQKADGTLDNNSYLKQLKKIQAKQRYIQGTGISIYFLLLTIGLILYMAEFAQRDLVFGIITYSITLTWIAFAWFYLRKRTIAKQEKELNEQIERIERLINNINDMEK